MKYYSYFVLSVGFTFAFLPVEVFSFGQSILEATQDTFIDKGQSNEHFETIPLLMVKKSEQEAYYQFDLTTFTSPLQSAYFQVGIVGHDRSNIQVSHTSQSWVGSNLNWGSRLRETTSLIKLRAMEDDYLKVDLRDLLNDYIKKGKSSLTLVISSTDSKNHSLNLASLESGDVKVKPTIHYDNNISGYPFSFGIDYASTKKGIYTSHTLASVTGIIETSRYGGWKSLNVGGTGHFRTERINDAWTLVDPDGYIYISMGLNTVKTAGNIALPNTIKKFGINTLGSWSSESIKNIAYTPRWNMLSKFIHSKKELSRLYNDKLLVPVFYPGFEDFVDKIAKELVIYADDPYVLGHFSDNELNFHKKVQLSGSLALNNNNPLYVAADKWLKIKHGRAYSKQDITEEDELEYEGYVADTYYKIVRAAIKRYAPNQLYLGSRLHADAKSNPYIIKAAAKYTDVISINYYGRWQPDSKHLALWEAADKPFLVTEFYTKAKDSGLNNINGAGWLVDTQNDRSLFFENFALQLMASKSCVGWHWFKYIDDDGANKGVFDGSYHSYTMLQESMAQIAQMIYPLRSYLLDGTVDFSGLASSGIEDNSKH
jgi:hypothetical protein